MSFVGHVAIITEDRFRCENRISVRSSGMDIQTKRGKGKNIDSHDDTVRRDILLILIRVCLLSEKLGLCPPQLLRQAGKQNFVRASASGLYDIAF